MKKEYWINVKHVDNRLVIFLNGETVWDSGIVHEDPELDKFINITEALQLHPGQMSELIFEGFNDHYNASGEKLELNPWHFHYRVFTRTIDDNGNIVSEIDLLDEFNQKHISNPNVRAINNSYQIAVMDKEFRVISNSLSEQFFK